MRYLTIIFVFSAVSLWGQSADSLVEIQIVNDSLKTFANSPELTIPLRCKNNGNKNLIMYGFNSNLLTAYVDRLCGNLEKIGGGIGVLIFNAKHERVYAMHTIPDSIDYKPIPKERFEQLMGYNRMRYLAGTKILKALDISYVDKKFNLREFSLKKGTYQLQLIVFAGKSLVTKGVGIEQIEKDKKEYNAELYQGCAISNQITFRVD